MLRRLVALVAISAGALLAVVPGAGASGQCPPGWAPTSVPGAGVICVRVTDPGEPGDPGEPASPPPSSGGECQRENGQPVDCVSPWGVWVYFHHVGLIRSRFLGGIRRGEGTGMGPSGCAH